MSRLVPDCRARAGGAALGAGPGSPTYSRGRIGPQPRRGCRGADRADRPRGGADLIVVDPPADGPLFRIQLPVLPTESRSGRASGSPPSSSGPYEAPADGFPGISGRAMARVGPGGAGKGVRAAAQRGGHRRLGGACRVVATTDSAPGEHRAGDIRAAADPGPPSDPRKGSPVSGPGDVGVTCFTHGHMGRPARLPARTARAPRNPRRSHLRLPTTWP